MNLHWLLRLKRMHGRRASRTQVLFFAGALVLGLGLVAIETWIGWPEWMTPNSMRLR